MKTIVGMSQRWCKASTTAQRNKIITYIIRTLLARNKSMHVFYYNNKYTLKFNVKKDKKKKQRMGVRYKVMI